MNKILYGIGFSAEGLNGFDPFLGRRLQRGYRNASGEYLHLMQLVENTDDVASHDKHTLIIPCAF